MHLLQLIILVRAYFNRTKPIFKVIFVSHLYVLIDHISSQDLQHFSQTLEIEHVKNKVLQD